VNGYSHNSDHLSTQIYAHSGVYKTKSTEISLLSGLNFFLDTRNILFNADKQLKVVNGTIALAIFSLE